MVGADAEKGGIAKNGAKLVTAVACADVPKFTIVFGSSAGAGNYGMWYVHNPLLPLSQSINPFITKKPPNKPANHNQNNPPILIPSPPPHSGRAYSPRFLWMWPNAKIGVMGPEQLASVMETVTKSKTPTTAADRDLLRARIERETDAVFSSARLWDDGVIPPAQTRQVLAQGLRAAFAGGMGGREREGGTKWGVFRM